MAIKFKVIFSPEAVALLRALGRAEQVSLLRMIELGLTHLPTQESKSRIKKLKGFRRPAYRLRVDEFRVLYVVSGQTVEILALLHKDAVNDWLEQFGTQS